MNNELMMSDQQARLDVLDIGRSFIVQAPAGSGKTELLIQRYLHLLGAVDEPEEIVAITFTRKAAQEMRQRVVSALQMARNGDDASEPHQQITLQAARKVLQRDADAAWNLLQVPRRMRIQTLDAFNAGIARALPVSSGLGGISRIIADAEMQSLYRQAATATLDWLGTQDSMRDVVESVLTHLDNNTSMYISHLARMLQSRDQWLALLGSGIHSDAGYSDARHKLEHSIADVITGQLQRVRDRLPGDIRSELAVLIDYAAGNLEREGKQDEPLVALRGCVDLPGCGVGDRQAWQAIAQLLLTQQGSWRKAVTKANGFPAGDNGEKKALHDIIERLRQLEGFVGILVRVSSLPPPQYSDGQWRVLTSLLRLLPQAVGELRRMYAEKSVCDHIEVALAAASALGTAEQPGEIALQLDYRIKHLLVDEMQDTSLRQYQLLEQLIAGWSPGDGRTLFCVGDPMQSIYRFRDAEVGQFLLARDHGIGAIQPEFRILRQNFRSGEHLVHWFNTVFSQVMSIQDDISAGAIAYAESVPVVGHAGKGSARLYPLIDFSAAAEAKFSANLIGECLQEHPHDSLAVLVRSRTQLIDLLSELSSAGIGYHAVELDRLTDLPEIIDLLALTRALSHEGDRIAWLGLLHGPLVGLLWQDILALVVNDSHSTVVELMANPERLSTLSDDAVVRLQSFDSTLAALRDHVAAESLRDRVERSWFALGGPGLLCSDDQIANVYEYFDVLEKFETAGTLADVSELESLLDQERVSSIAGSDCKLQIMTMHKSKGLQFDHVFLHGLGRGTRASQKSVLSWLTVPDGQSGNMIISPIGPRAELEDDQLHQFIEATEKDKQRHELDRLLYVACTRARKSLHLVATVMSSTDGKKLRGAHAGSLLQRLWPAVEDLYERAFAERPEQAKTQAAHDDEQYRNPACRRYRTPWRHAAAPDLPMPAVSAECVAEDTEQKVPFYWVGAGARHAGTIVHRWLHHMATTGNLTVAANVTEQKRISAHWARQLAVNEDEIDAICTRVSRALEETLSDAKGRWLLEGEGYTELPLTGLWNGQVVSVVIDRVRIDEQGTHWIVDYKTSTHEGGDLAGFLKQETDRYRQQLRKYAGIYSAITEAPVRTALYFPLLQEFCEVES